MSEQPQQDWTPEYGDRSIVAFLSAQVIRLEEQLAAAHAAQAAINCIKNAEEALAAERERHGIQAKGQIEENKLLSQQLVAEREKLKPLVKALEGYYRLCDGGWIPPENKTQDYVDGWEDACSQFQISQAHEIGQDALARHGGLTAVKEGK
jgi:hypothetical protein